MPPRPLHSFLPVKEAAFLRPLTLPRQTVRHQAFPLTPLWQLLTFLPAKEVILPQQLLTFPLGEGSSSFQAIAHHPSGEGSNASQATALLPPTVKEAVFPRPLALPRQVSLAIQLGQSGMAIGVPPGTGHPSLPRKIAPSPGKTTPPPPPSRPPKFF